MNHPQANRYPWLRTTRSETPRYLKTWLTIRYLASYPWYRYRCRDGPATPLGRFCACWFFPRRTLRRWHHGLPATAFAGLATDPNPTIRMRAADALWDRGTSSSARIRAEELPESATAELARRLAASTVPIGMHSPLAWWLWVRHGGERLLARLVEHGEVSDEESVKQFSRIALGLVPREELHSAAFDPALPRRIRGRAVELFLADGATDPVTAAPLCLAAGLVPRYRRLDPDGSLLVVGYAALGAQRRARLRTVLTDLGELDLLRLLHRASRSRTVDMSDGDDSARDPADRFRAHLAAPIIDAVEAVARLRDWRPDDDADRRLRELLRRTDVAALRRSRRDLTGFGTRPIELPETTVGIGPAAFSPDGSRCAVELRGRDRRIVEYAVATGEPVGELVRPWSEYLITLVRTGCGLAALEEVKEGCRVSFAVDGDVRSVAEFPRGFGVDYHLAPVRDGFLYQYGASVYVRYGRTAPRELPGLDAAPDGERIRAITTDATGRHLAILHDAMIRVHDVVTDEPRCHTEPFDAATVMFADTDTIISVKDHSYSPRWNYKPGGPTLKRWSIDGTELVERGSRKHEAPSYRWGNDKGVALHRLSGGARVLAVLPDNQNSPHHGDGLIAVDAVTLDRVRLPEQPGWRVVAAAPDTRTFLGATHFDKTPRLSLRTLAPHPLAAIVDTPMTDLRPADLAVVERELAAADATTRPLVELLYHCLRHRFRHEIALGDPVTGTDYDIRLGGDP